MAISTTGTTLSDALCAGLIRLISITCHIGGSAEMKRIKI
jgi:hypothetical protein